MADSAEQAVPAGGTAASERAHTLRMTLVVVALAAGFAFVPRATQSCGKASGTEEAPDFTASVVANAARSDADDDHDERAPRPSGRASTSGRRGAGRARPRRRSSTASRSASRTRASSSIGVNTSDADGLARALRGQEGPLVPDRLRRGQRHREASTASTTSRRSSSSRRTGRSSPSGTA